MSIPKTRGLGGVGYAFAASRRRVLRIDTSVTASRLLRMHCPRRACTMLAALISIGCTYSVNSLSIGCTYSVDMCIYGSLRAPCSETEHLVLLCKDSLKVGDDLIVDCYGAACLEMGVIQMRSL